MDVIFKWDNYMYSENSFDFDMLVIENDEMCYLNFLLQPIYDPINLDVIHFEVLSEVYFDFEGDQTKDDFFLSCSNELIKEVSLKQIEFFGGWNIGKVFFVNIRLSCMADDYFVEMLMERSDLGYFIEINEFDCEIDNNMLLNFGRLQKKGVMLSLDDYHLNYKEACFSLGLIKWDYIKVDKKFIDYHVETPIVIKTLINMLSKFCKKGVILEGIETCFHLNSVRCLGALSQGFYIYPPARWD